VTLQAMPIDAPRLKHYMNSSLNCSIDWFNCFPRLVVFFFLFRLFYAGFGFICFLIVSSFNRCSGEDDSGCDFVRIGGDGVISVTANVAPAAMHK
jgi:hypothetical protein